MHRVVEEDENDPVASPTNAAFRTGPNPSAFRSPFGTSLEGDAPFGTPPTVRSPPNTDHYPADYNFNRRTSVSAESLKPTTENNDTNWTPPYHEKTPGQLERLQKAVEGNFLFSHLEEEQSAQILGALYEKPIPAKGIKVRIKYSPQLAYLSLTRDVLYRLSAKEMPEIISTLSRRGRSTSMSTAVESYSRDPTVWARRSAPSKPADPLANSPSCTTTPAPPRSSRPSQVAPCGPSTATRSDAS